ncbi:VTT domain-containing protein, partial [bacterium]|nr:VTT domain-containing protein [bacterium]
FKERKEKKERIRQEKEEISKEVKNIIHEHKDFTFHHRRKKGYISTKDSPEDISDLEAEEWMMRFYGLFVQKSRIGKLLKLIMITSLFFIAYYNWDIVQSQYTIIINSFPFLKNMIGFIFTALDQKLLIGIFLFTFFSNLFFLTLPDEIYFITYLLAGHNILILIPVVVTAGLLGLTIDYFVGRLLGVFILRKLLKKKYYKFKFASDRYGGSLLVVGNIIPSPVQLFSVALGAFNYGYIRFIIFSAIGKTLKYTALFYGLNYYTSTLDPMIDNSLKPQLARLQQCMRQNNISLMR